MKPEEKNATVSFALTSAELDVLRDAATASDKTLAEFVLESALKAADNVFRVHPLVVDAPMKTNTLYLTHEELEQEFADAEEILKPKLKKLMAMEDPFLDEEDPFADHSFVD